MKVANVDIRVLIAVTDVKNWQIADYLGIGTATFQRWIRTELDQEKKDKIIKAINELSGREFKKVTGLEKVSDEDLLEELKLRGLI